MQHRSEPDRPSSRYAPGQLQPQVTSGTFSFQQTSYTAGGSHQRGGQRLSVPIRSLSQPNTSPVSYHRPLSYSAPGASPGGRSNRSTRSSPTSSPRSHSPPILFYDKSAPHYTFTNFSPHSIRYNGQVYPTSEHLFQSLKFEHRPNLAEHIRTCSKAPRVAFSEAQRFAPEKRRDWNKVSISKMEEIVFLKFTQHADLKDELLRTGNAELIEDSPVDSFWGVGSDGKGRNELGKVLMRVRERIRNGGH